MYVKVPINTSLLSDELYDYGYKFNNNNNNNIIRIIIAIIIMAEMAVV